MAISNDQIKIIHILKNKRGLTDEEYRQILSDKFGVTSCKDMLFWDASDLIKHLNVMDDKPKPRKAITHNSNITYLATPKQLKYIDYLKSCILWHAENGFDLWLENRFKITKIITMKHASSTIEALKAMVERQKNIKGGSL